MMESKLGIKVYTFTSGDYKDVGNPFREMTVDEQIYLEDTLIAPTFNRFVGIVDEGRKNLTDRDVRDLANGKVYTAEQALANGLVDQIGFFDTAVEKAKDLAGLTEARVVEYRRQSSLFDFLAVGAERARTPEGHARRRERLEHAPGAHAVAAVRPVFADSPPCACRRRNSVMTASGRAP